MIEKRLTFVVPKPVLLPRRRTGFWILFFAALILACELPSLPFLSDSTPRASDRIKVIVREGGWTRVTSDSLRAAGLDLNAIDAATVQIFDGATEIPARRSREDIEFYAQPSTTPFVGENAYTLKWNLTRGIAFAENPAGTPPTTNPATTFTATLTLEENPLYIPEALGTDRHLWQRLTAPAETTINAPLTDRAAGDASVQVTLWSLSQDQKAHPNHHVQLAWNQRAIGTAQWDGQLIYTMTATIPASALRDGQNALQLKLPGDTGALADIVILDRVQIFYPRQLRAVQDLLEFETRSANVKVEGLNSSDTEIYDITDPRAPIRLVSMRVEPSSVTFATHANSTRHFLVVGKNATPRAPLRIVPMSTLNLRDTSLRADEIIVTYPAFADALKPLVEWREQRGIKSRVVTTEQVYDEFSFGRADPAALRAFFAYALDRWNPAPRFVLLVGKASHDIDDSQQGPNKNLVPTHLQTTLNLGEAASDNWFVTLSDEDIKPRLAIGRLPAKSVEQVKTVVEKIRAYEARTNMDWQKRAVFVADAKEPQFAESVDALAARLPTTIQARKILPAVTKAELETRRAEIVREWNAGALLMTYIGHGSIDTWAAGPLISAKDLANLANRSALPILLTPTCLDGYFYDPEKDSLAEQLLFNPNGGIIAGVVPTGLSFPEAQDRMTDLFARAWFDERLPTLGEALTRAKQQMPRDSSADEVVETFVVLGDPALALPN